MLNVLVNSTIICLGNQSVAVLLGRNLVVERTRSADTAALTCHTLDEILRQSGCFQKKQCFLTLGSSVCHAYLCIDLILRLFQTLKNSCGYTAGICKTLTEGGCDLIIVCSRLQYAFMIARISL